MSAWRSIGLLPESSFDGRYPDPSFDMPSIKDCSCPACEEALFIEFGKCEEPCGCYCHNEEKP